MIQFISLYIGSRTRKLSYRKEDRAMRPIYVGALKIFESP